MKILKETDAKRTKIEEVIGHIEARIAELEEEKAELYECEKLDRQRRALDYLVANHGLEKARQQVRRARHACPACVFRSACQPPPSLLPLGHSSKS